MALELRAQHNKDIREGIVQYHHGINCWSPVVNIMRHWGWGRNDEVSGCACYLALWPQSHHDHNIM